MMKVRCVLYVLLAVCLFSSALFADAKKYVDYELGYSGEASITYIDIEEDRQAFFEDATKLMENFFEEEGLKYRFTNKFTKEEDWLVWKALNEYDYKDNEVYLIMGTSSSNQLFEIFIRVYEDGKSVDFVSAYID